MNHTQKRPKRRQEKQLFTRRKHRNHMGMTDRPRPDAPPLTQNNNCANGLLRRHRCRLCFSSCSASISTVVFAQIVRKGLSRSFVVEQFLNLFFWRPQAFKVLPSFPFTSARVYVKLDLTRLIHVPFAELSYLDDVRLDSSGRLFIEKSDLATMWDTKVTQLHNEELDLCRLIVKIDLGFASFVFFLPKSFNFELKLFSVFC